MIKKNIDGIKKQNRVLPKKPLVKAVRKVYFDGIIVQRKLSVPLAPKIYTVYKTPRQSRGSFFKSFYSKQRLPVFAALFAILLAFGGGMWAALNTESSHAEFESPPQVLAAETVETQKAIPLSTGRVSEQDSANNDILFNTPIEYLKNYLAQVSEPGEIAKRKELLTSYLQERHSPFVEAAGTISQQPHWQLILAIAFAESTLGKNCADNNCSNIGVKPGAPTWRKYESYKDWVIDFNHLLDKRYNDWTLEEMCGVYVKPCNPNWLAATQQILDELKDRGIE